MFLGRKETLPIQLPPFWPRVSSLGLYQDPKVGHGSWSRAGDALGSVHRQHLAHDGVQKESTRPGDQANSLIYLMNCLWLMVNREKTTTEPSQTLRVPRVYGEYESNGTVSPTGEDRTNLGGVLKLLAVRQISACTLSRRRLVGKMNAASQVIP